MANFPINEFLQATGELAKQKAAAQDRPLQLFMQGASQAVPNYFQKLNHDREFFRTLVSGVGKEWEFYKKDDKGNEVRLNVDEEIPIWSKLAQDQTLPTGIIPKRREGKSLEQIMAEAEMRARGAQKGGETPGGVNKEVAAGEMKLRDDFRKDVGDYPKIRDSYGRVLASAKDPSPAGDLSLIYNYMKMLDPGSVVRESEFATAAATGSYGDRIQAAVKRIASGERLADDVREDFVSRSKGIYNKQHSQYKKTRSEYENISKSYGYDPKRVMPDLEIALEDTPGAEMLTFASEADAKKANLPKGTLIKIGTKLARVK